MKRHVLAAAVMFSAAFAALGCGDDDDAQVDGGAGSDGAAVDSASARDAGSVDAAQTICTRTLGPADRTRKVVVSHPFTAQSGVKGTLFEVLELTTAGVLTRSNVSFNMGSAFDGAIAFTPDGEVGLVPQDDGSVGVFRFTAAGAPVVVHAGFKPGFYADSVAVSPDGTRAYILDGNTPANGGGVYEADIRCDGTLALRGRTVPGGPANAIAFLDGMPARAVLASRNVAGGGTGDVHVMDFSLTAPPVRVASASPFGDADAIPSWAAVTPDGMYAVIADNGIITGNRLAVVRLPGLTAAYTITTDNPAAVVWSPFGNAGIVLNSDGMDAIRRLTYDPNAATPIAIAGEITYVNGRPQLPVVPAMITRGLLRGRVLVGENVAVRQLQFAAAGTVTDVGLINFGSGSTAIVGTVGVQP